MRPTLLIASTALLLLASITTLADDGAEDPSRFYGPTKWDLSIQMSCDLDSTPDPNGGRYSIHDKADVHGRVDTRAAIDMAATRTLHGKPDGSASANDVMVDVVKQKKMVWRDVNHPGPDADRVEDLNDSEIANNGQCSGEDNRNWQFNGLHCEHPTDAVITTTSKLNGQGLGDRADLRLEIHAAYGNYYVLGVTDLDPNGTMTTAIDTLVNGKSTHTQDDQPGSKDLGFLSQRFPLPAHGMILSGSATIDGQPCPTFRADATATRTITWTAKPVDDQPLKAVAGGPYSATRGATVTLDGRGSKGEPTSYHWHVSPKPCPTVDISGGSHGGATGKEWDGDGATVSFPLLCDATATLTVEKDGKKDTSDPVDVTVKARPWQVKISDPATGTIDSPIECSAGDCLLQGGVAGRNVCTVDELKVSMSAKRHWFHHKGDTFLGPDGYETATASGGPFDGMAYVSANHLRIARTEQVNKQFTKNSEIWKYNHGKQADPRDAAYLEALDASIPAHESEHTTLAMAAFSALPDPAKTIEALVAPNAGALQQDADLECNDVDGKMADASTDAKVHAALAPAHPEWDKAALFYVHSATDHKTWVETTIGNILGASENDAPGP